MRIPSDFSNEELEEWCHRKTIQEIAKVREALDYYVTMYFGFDRRAKEARTEEWIDKASKRLEGKTEPCCECGESYPAADLHLRDHVFCEKCRKE